MDDDHVDSSPEVTAALNERYRTAMASVLALKKEHKKELSGPLETLRRTRTGLLAFGISRPGLRKGKKHTQGEDGSSITL